MAPPGLTLFKKAGNFVARFVLALNFYLHFGN